MRSRLNLVGTVALIAAAFALPSVVNSPYWLGVLVTAWIFAIAASGLNLVSGFLGEMSLAHHGLFAVGAYTSSLVATHAEITPLLGILAAVSLAAIVGYVVGAISFRAMGASFAIATFGFGQLIGLGINGWDSVTRGVLGLSSPPLIFSVAGREVEVVTPRSYYFLALIALLLTLAGIVLFLRSRTGRSTIAIREHADLASSIGVNVYRVRVVVFALSAASAGLAGALYAHYIRFIGPGTAGIYYLVAFLIMVVFGGNGTILGPVLGALVFTVVPEFLRASEQSRLLVFAILLLVFIMLSPKGVVPGLASVGRSLRDRAVKRLGVSRPTPGEVQDQVGR